MRSPDVIGHIEILDLADAAGAGRRRSTPMPSAAGEPNPAYQARAHSGAARAATQNVGFLVKTSRVRIDAVTAGARAGHVRQSEQRSDRNAARSAAARAPRDRRSARPQPAPGHRHRQPPALVHRHRARGRRRPARARKAEGAGGVGGRLLQELQTDNPGTAVISIGDYNAYQFNDGYTDPIAIAEGIADARRPDRRRRQPGPGESELRQPD